MDLPVSPKRATTLFSVGRGEPCVRPSFLQTGNIADRWPGIQRNVSCQANLVFALKKVGSQQSAVLVAS